MDTVQLAHETTNVIIHCLPYLVTAGGKIGEGILKQIGSDTWNLGKSIWSKLGDRLQAKPAAQEALQKAIERPDDSRVKGALELQIEDVLNEDSQLADEIEHLIEQARPNGGTVVVSGDRSVGIGGDANNNTIITGDDSEVSKNP